MLNEREKILHNAIYVYGQEKQIDMAVEEVGELLAAINRCKRGRVGVSAVQEEIADVKIVIDQLAIIFGESDVYNFEKLKLARLKERISKHL